MIDPAKTAVPATGDCPPGTPGPTIAVGATRVRLEAEGAVWIESERALVVADLHLEKGSAHARRAMMLPPWDSHATLARLKAVADRLQPRTIVSLGDAFHDPGGAARLDGPALVLLAGLMRGRDWIWIAGNHDPVHEVDLGGLCVDSLQIAGLTLRHHPTPGRAPGELAGHLHPAARVQIGATTVRRSAFATDGSRMILPAFGAYAGGLNVRDRAFHGLFEPRRFVVGLLGEGRVHLCPGRLVR